MKPVEQTSSERSIVPGLSLTQRVDFPARLNPGVAFCPPMERGKLAVASLRFAGGGKTKTSARSLKVIIWAYFVLLIFEGALRKWVLPGLATPLLIVRDPLAVAALLIAVGKGLLNSNWYFFWLGIVALISPIFAMAFGHGNLAVTAFGWRCNFLHFPFIFLIGAVFKSEDVKKMGWVILCLSLPMTLLMAAQFYSPQGALINIGVGGEGDAGFDGAMGYRRPPGTFSFITGLVAFYSWVAAYAFYHAMSPGARGKWVGILGSMTVVAAIPFSISRSMLISVLIVAVGGCIALICGGGKARRIIQTGFLVALIAAGMALVPGLDTPREAFLSRWEASTTIKGGVKIALVDRVIKDLSGGLMNNSNSFMVGQGLGMGTNAGAKLLSGTVTFLISEGEWGRLTGEMGLPLGLMFIMIRIVLLANLFAGSWKAAKQGEPLALLLWFAVAPNLLMGQWAQPNILGFATLGAGLIMALNKSVPAASKSGVCALSIRAMPRTGESASTCAAASSDGGGRGNGPNLTQRVQYPPDR